MSRTIAVADVGGTHARFERRMEAIQVKFVSHPQPGLDGGAATFAKEFQ